MIFIQHGPSWRPKIELALDSKLVDGVIWDPREEKIERINRIRHDNKDYSDILQMIDSKFYYKQFGNSILKKLELLEFIPDSILDRTYFRNLENIKESVNKIIAFQQDMNVNFILTPTLYITNFNDRIIDRLFDICDIFVEECDKQKITQEKYVSFLIHESAFEQSSYINEFLSDISLYSDKFDGIYFVIDRDKTNDNIRNNFSSTRLANVMQLIYGLNFLGFKIAIGYCGIEAINYVAAGAKIIGTGWFYSLRRFNKEDKGLEPVENMGRMKLRYTSLKLLSELTIEEQLLQLPPASKSKLLTEKGILNGDDIDAKIANGDINKISFNETFIQYLKTIKKLTDIIIEKDSISERISLLHRIITAATKNIDDYNKHVKIGTNRLTDKHLKAYKTAVETFKEENLIL